MTRVGPTSVSRRPATCYVGGKRMLSRIFQKRVAFELTATPAGRSHTHVGYASELLESLFIFPPLSDSLADLYTFAIKAWLSFILLPSPQHFQSASSYLLATAYYKLFSRMHGYYQKRVSSAFFECVLPHDSDFFIASYSNLHMSSSVPIFESQILNSILRKSCDNVEKDSSEKIFLSFFSSATL